MKIEEGGGAHVVKSNLGGSLRRHPIKKLNLGGEEDHLWVSEQL